MVPRVAHLSFLVGSFVGSYLALWISLLTAEQLNRRGNVAWTQLHSGWYSLHPDRRRAGQPFVLRRDSISTSAMDLFIGQDE